MIMTSLHEMKIALTATWTKIKVGEITNHPKHIYIYEIVCMFYMFCTDSMIQT